MLRPMLFLRDISDDKGANGRKGQRSYAFQGEQLAARITELRDVEAANGVEPV